MTDDRIASLRLEELDTDGALRETMSRLPTRGQFLGLGAGSALVGAAAVLRPGTARARESARDVRILNFALALEYLQAAFYTETERGGVLRGALADQARVVGSHERAHVKAFRAVLGSSAIAQPRFDFRDTTDSRTSFRATAVAFEDLAVAAYKEQLPRISSRQYLATAVAVHSVEARHASWIRRLAGIVPAPDAFDDASSDSEVVGIVNRTRFVTLRVPHTSTRHSPKFTG